MMMWWLIILIVLLVVMLVVMKIVVKGFKMFLKASLVALIFAFIIFGFIKLFGGESPEEMVFFGEVKECHLDMCDCGCYFEGWDSKGKIESGDEPVLCGINCLGEFNVTGCRYVEGKGCIEVYE